MLPAFSKPRGYAGDAVMMDYIYGHRQEQLETPADEVFRIGGLVEEGSIKRGEGTVVSFSVTDGNRTVPVSYEGVLPDLFGEGQGMIALGRMEGEVFIATEVLAKHDETYMPKEVVDALKEQGVYQEPES